MEQQSVTERPAEADCSGARVYHPDEADSFATEERCDILESWNQPRDPAVSIARATVAVGVKTRLHALRETTERYLILQGTGRVRVGDLPITAVHPGDLVFIPPDCPQAIRNTGKEPLVFLAICSPRFLPEHYQDLGDDARL